MMRHIRELCPKARGKFERSSEEVRETINKLVTKWAICAQA